MAENDALLTALGALEGAGSALAGFGRPQLPGLVAQESGRRRKEALGQAIASARANPKAFLNDSRAEVRIAAQEGLERQEATRQQLETRADTVLNNFLAVGGDIAERGDVNGLVQHFDSFTGRAGSFETSPEVSQRFLDTLASHHQQLVGRAKTVGEIQDIQRGGYGGMVEGAEAGRPDPSTMSAAAREALRQTDLEVNAVGAALAGVDPQHVKGPYQGLITDIHEAGGDFQDPELRRNMLAMGQQGASILFGQSEDEKQRLEKVEGVQSLVQPLQSLSVGDQLEIGSVTTDADVNRLDADIMGLVRETEQGTGALNFDDLVVLENYFAGKRQPGNSAKVRQSAHRFLQFEPSDGETTQRVGALLKVSPRADEIAAFFPGDEEAIRAGEEDDYDGATKTVSRIYGAMDSHVQGMFDSEQESLLNDLRNAENTLGMARSISDATAETRLAGEVGRLNRKLQLVGGIEAGTARSRIDHRSLMDKLVDAIGSNREEAVRILASSLTGLDSIDQLLVARQEGLLPDVWDQLDMDERWEELGRTMTSQMDKVAGATTESRISDVDVRAFRIYHTMVPRYLRTIRRGLPETPFDVSRETVERTGQAPDTDFQTMLGYRLIGDAAFRQQ